MNIAVCVKAYNTGNAVVVYYMHLLADRVALGGACGLNGVEQNADRIESLCSKRTRAVTELRNVLAHKCPDNGIGGIGKERNREADPLGSLAADVDKVPCVCVGKAKQVNVGVDVSVLESKRGKGGVLADTDDNLCAGGLKSCDSRAKIG